jgi:hypothetical protein
MATALLPLPSLDFDPTEVAVRRAVLRDRGHQVVFATPDGSPARADELMVSGRGLDPWGAVPVPPPGHRGRGAARTQLVPRLP